MSNVNSLSPALRARNGIVLWVVIVARISTDHQDLKSLEDQEAKCRRYITDNYQGKVEFEVLASRGSGEHLDRKELGQLEELIESRRIDVVIAEDLSRICRRRKAYDLCEMCIDFDSRLIAINDRVDTSVNGWEDSAFISTWHHERSNRDTSDRIRRSLNNRFDQGGVVQFTIYGYIKLPGAKTDQGLQKDPAAEPIIAEMFRLLDHGASYSEIADWLNLQGIKPGPYCRRREWCCQMVRRFFHEPILKGVRVRNRKVSKRINKTGHRKTVKGEPGQLRIRNCPHLAFVEPEYYDRVLQAADERNRHYARTSNGNPDARQGVPKKRTDFPGQHAICGVCGRLMYWQGMKGTKVMVCSGATEYRCWNSLYVNGEECARRIVEAALELLCALPEFDAVFGELVRQHSSELEGQSTARRQTLQQELNEVNQRLQNLLSTLEQRPESAALLVRLDEYELTKSRLEHDIKQLNLEPSLHIALPEAAELRRHAIASLQGMVTSNQETCRLLRQLIPELLIVPYQVCDESDIIPRAEFAVSLTSLLPPALQAESAAAVFTHRLVVTLAEPSQRVRHCGAAAELQKQGLKQREIGTRLGMAQSATEAALRISRLMIHLGISEPYIRLTAVPKVTNRLKRHKHPRFRFEPLDGFPKVI